MPPLSQNDIIEIQKKLEPAFKVLKIEDSFSMPDEEKIKTHEIAKEAIKWRKKQDAVSSLPEYKNPAVFGGRYRRIVPYYLETADTPEAKKKNAELYKSLESEEGCKAFANRVAKDLLNIRYEEFFFTGNEHEAVKKYAENPRIYELGWVAADLLTDDNGILDRDIYNALEDRKELFQNLAIYNEFTAKASTKTYLVCDGISQEKIQEKEYKCGFLDDGFNDFIQNKELSDDFDEFCSKHSDCELYYANGVKEKFDYAGKLIRYGKLNTYTVMNDGEGKRIDIKKGIDKLCNGEKVIISKTSPEVESKIDDMLDFAPELIKPIHMPTKEEEDKKAIYDAFSKEALSARGKELQKEFSRLGAVMDSAKLWYTKGSPEFVNITNALNKYSDPSVILNTDQSKVAMSEILTECGKYIKSKAGKTLKDRELKRLDAVGEVADSLQKKLDMLNSVTENAKKQREITEAENKRAEAQRLAAEKAEAYRNTLREISGENGAAGELAATTLDTMGKLEEYSGLKQPDEQYREFFGEKNFRSRLAQMIMLGMIRQERRRLSETDKPEEKGKIEKMLDTMFSTEKGKEKAISAIAKTDTVNDLVEQIKNSAEFTEKYFVENGADRLVEALNNELKAKYPEDGPADNTVDVRNVAEPGELNAEPVQPQNLVP